jgi:hypothetical protein
MNELKAQIATDVWNPDALAKRLFVLVMVGVTAYVIAILTLLSSAD